MGRVLAVSFAGTIGDDGREQAKALANNVGDNGLDLIQPRFIGVLRWKSPQAELPPRCGKPPKLRAAKPARAPERLDPVGPAIGRIRRQHGIDSLKALHCRLKCVRLNGWRNRRNRRAPHDRRRGYELHCLSGGSIARAAGIAKLKVYLVGQPCRFCRLGNTQHASRVYWVGRPASAHVAVLPDQPVPFDSLVAIGPSRVRSVFS